MSLPKNLTGWGGAGIAAALTELAAQQNLSVAGGAANAALPVPGLVTGQSLIQTLSLDANGKPLSPQPVFTVTYGAAGAESTIASPTATTGGTVRVTYGPAGSSANVTYSSLVGKGAGISANAVPTPAVASVSGYQADLGAIQADAKPTPGAEAYPIANFTDVVSNLSVAFTDTTTYSDGAAFERLWNFGDGNTSTAVNPTHVYATGANYDVTLEVTDANGHQDGVTKVVSASASI